jgi:energy-converting hydrogenase Eha subunit G
MATKRVIILARVGSPLSGAILAPGAAVDMPEFWAEKYVAEGKARFADEKKAKAEPDAKVKVIKGKKK